MSETEQLPMFKDRVVKALSIPEDLPLENPQCAHSLIISIQTKPHGNTHSPFVTEVELCLQGSKCLSEGADNSLNCLLSV